MNSRSSPSTPTFADVRRRYADGYLRRLALEHHLIELHAKLQKALAEDRCPFREPAFNKELADLAVLLELHTHHDPDFAALVAQRRHAFVKKLPKKE